MSPPPPPTPHPHCNGTQPSVKKGSSVEKGLISMCRVHTQHTDAASARLMVQPRCMGVKSEDACLVLITALPYPPRRLSDVVDILCEETATRCQGSIFEQKKGKAVTPPAAADGAAQ
jgi:hypothetical protein